MQIRFEVLGICIFFGDVDEDWDIGVWMLWMLWMSGCMGIRRIKRRKGKKCLKCEKKSCRMKIGSNYEQIVNLADLG